MYSLEWQWFMDGTINAAGFVRALILRHGLNEPDAKHEFETRWGRGVRLSHYPTDSEIIKLYTYH